MTSRFLFTCWPFLGHVLPQISIATALRESGHEVAFYSGESARGYVALEGHELFPFERVDEETAHRNVTDVETWAGRPGRRRPRRLARAMRDWLVETIPDQVADLQQVQRTWRPDVLVTDLSMWAPIVILWESMPIPVALSSTFMGPLIPGRDAPPWGFGLPPPRTPASRLRAAAITAVMDMLARGSRRRINELRAGQGLGPLGCSVNEFTGRLPLYLVGNIPALDYDRRDLPPTVHYVGPCTWNPPTDDQTEAWLDALPRDQPWVHVTESTLRHADPFLLRAAAQGLAHRPVEVVMTTGHHRDPSSVGLGPLAPNVHVTPWVSHIDLLPRCAAVVTTGGQATIMAAFSAGVPLVVVPTTWDKPDNACRITEAGLGVRVEPDDCTPAALAAAVDRVLEEPAFRANAERMAKRLASTKGPSRAAELLASLAAAGAGSRGP